MFFRTVVVVCLCLACAAVSARADGTLSLWGGPGLLQTPAARLPSVGTVTTGVGVVRGAHRHISVGVTPAPWLWLGLRQTAYVNDYGLLEPGVDAAVRLAAEGPLHPAVVVGWRDALGSGPHLPGIGRFSGEYLVASKRWWSLDLNAGLGWGRFAGRSTLGNPVRWGARERPASGPAARGPRNWFSGRSVGVFGGVAWRTPVDGLTLLAEYASDAQTAERSEDPTRRRPSPFNFGVAWRPFPDPYDPFEFAFGYEGGRTALLRLTLRFGPEKFDVAGAGPPPAVPRPRAQAGLELEKALPPQPFRDALPLFENPDTGGHRDDIVAVGPDGATLWLPRSDFPSAPLGRDVGRALRRSAAQTSSETGRLTAATRPYGLDGVAVSVPREALLRAADGRGSAEELLQAAEITPAGEVAAPPASPWAWRNWTAGLRLGAEQSLFEHGAEAPLRSFVDIETTWSPSPGATLGATVRRHTLNTLEGLNNRAAPVASPVRSDLAEYGYGVSLERFYLALRRSLDADRHIAFDIGLLEEMFGGFGGEALYQPFAGRVAVGAALHRVWKRPAGHGARLDYGRGATTGLATLYYEGEGGAWTAQVEAGRYLGGDRGGGVSFSRRLPGAAQLELHAAWTDGPRPGQAQYGGKPEYGARLTVPLGALGDATRRLLTGRAGRRLPVRMDSAIRTLGRDAGQKLDRPAPLHQTLSSAGYGRLTGTWSSLLD